MVFFYILNPALSFVIEQFNRFSQIAVWMAAPAAVF